MNKLLFIALALMIPHMPITAENSIPSQSKKIDRKDKAYKKFLYALGLSTAAVGCFGSGVFLAIFGTPSALAKGNWGSAIISIPLGAGLVVVSVPVGKRALKMFKSSITTLFEDEETDENSPNSSSKTITVKNKTA